MSEGRGRLEVLIVALARVDIEAAEVLPLVRVADLDDEAAELLLSLLLGLGTHPAEGIDALGEGLL